jgi:hypothetical protein
MALRNGPALMAEFSNSDRPIPADELARPLERWRGYDALAEHVLPFMIENQGVCVWAIRLDGNHDPAVLVEVDSGSPPQWQLCAERFSEWLKCQVHDRRLFGSSWFAAQALPLSSHVLAELRRRFDEGSQTYAWPGNTNYRFSNARAQLLLWNADGQCDWHIAPRTSDVAIAALDEIDEIAGVGGVLYPLREEFSGILHQWQMTRAKVPSLSRTDVPSTR